MLIAPALAALVIQVSAPADVSPALVDHVIAEAAAIWRPAGVSLSSQRAPSDPPASLHVVVSTRRGAPSGSRAPLGWIEFDGTTPQPRVYLSYANGADLLNASLATVGLPRDMPTAARDTFLGRVLGRALAHELGHYLLASKAHTTRGLMRANFRATELLSTGRGAFAITPEQRALAASRL
jgi:hypothetical protein